MAEGGYDPSRPKYSQVPVCRFFLQGKCNRGATCMYLHDSSHRPPPSKDNICRYYQLGCCKYGAKCRYDHVKAGKENNKPSPGITAIESKPPVKSYGNHSSSMVTLKKGGFSKSIEAAKEIQNKDDLQKKWVMAADFVPGQKYHGRGPVSYAAAVQPIDRTDYKATHQAPSSLTDVTEDSLLCPYFEQRGECPYEGQCGYLHGLICDMCGLPRLHPTDEKQRQEHERECVAEHEKEMELAFAFQASTDKECGICLENVMAKEGTDSDKRFGILENCTHCFCLSCIRKWRFNKSDVIQTQRTCPTCRTHSDFVTPSKFWVESPEEKAVLINEYKSAMHAKPCQYFKQGEGVCPFDKKCFYLHALEDGTLVEGNVIKQRRRTNAEGESASEEQISLWDFITRRQEDGSFLSLEDELSLVLLGIFEDDEDGNNSSGLAYDFLNGDLFRDSSSDSDDY